MKYEQKPVILLKIRIKEENAALLVSYLLLRISLKRRACDNYVVFLSQCVKLFQLFNYMEQPKTDNPGTCPYQ